MQAEILVAMFHSCRIERMSVRLAHLTPAEVHREPPTPPAHPTSAPRKDKGQTCRGLKAGLAAI